jgi:hypothetical protein
MELLQIFELLENWMELYGLVEFEVTLFAVNWLVGVPIV